jgi:16S rRNA (cytosine1402-N4)-methyltransferase
VNGLLADLGLSTNQLFDARYGLSFAQDMPLDMRIDPRTRLTAADLVNTRREEDLANVLYELAQERYSRRIARKIVEARRLSPITTTDRLADLVRSAIPSRSSHPRDRSRGGASEKIDPATRTFLALRMLVNQEMENLSAFLRAAPLALSPGGRLAVISFQSMEDRLVKQAFRSAEQTGLLKLVTKKPISPAADELARNPRSRSAKLRVAQRI